MKINLFFTHSHSYRFFSLLSLSVQLNWVNEIRIYIRMNLQPSNGMATLEWETRAEKK